MAESEPDTYRLKGRQEFNLPRDATAVLIIDPVNDFLSEGGAAWDLAKSTVEKNDVVTNLRRLIEGARARGVPVLFGPMAFTEEDYASEDLHRRSGIGRIMFERRMFLAGSWGADFHPDLRPIGDEIVLQPHKGTDVFETDLPQHLERLGVTHLVICGMAANLCCEGTGRHATEHGFDVTFLSDAIGAENLAAYEARFASTTPSSATPSSKSMSSCPHSTHPRSRHGRGQETRCSAQIAASSEPSRRSSSPSQATTATWWSNGA